MTDRASFQEVAGRLGVPTTTLKGWANRLRLGHDRSAKGKRYLTPDEIALLETAKILRDDGAGLETITRKLTVSYSSPDESLTNQRPSTDEQVTISDAESIAQVIRSELAAATDLAEKYARAAHRIGELESDNKHLLAQLDEARRLVTDQAKKIELLEAPKRPWWRLW